MATLSLDALGKRYPDGTEALKGLSVEIADGELVIFVGPSGCGKSTALRMIAGLERITSGELRIDGKRVNDLPPKRRDIAMVFQDYALYPQMTVAKNMAFSLRIAGRGRDEITRRVRDTAGVLGLTEHLERYPGQLSGGQRQRVAMVRAIVREPSAFLMDEPLSNLDAQLRVQMRAQIHALQRRLGTTTVYVTHDQTEAMTLGDRVVVLRDGETQQIGTPLEIYHEPANVFVAGFVGSPPMNLIRAHIADGRLRLPFGTVSLPTTHAAAPGDVIAGLRPEAFTPAEIEQADLRATPALVETLGSDVLAHFELADESRPLVVRLPASSGVAAGRIAHLAVDTSTLVLFDPDNQGRLRSPATPRYRRPADLAKGASS